MSRMLRIVAGLQMACALWPRQVYTYENQQALTIEYFFAASVATLACKGLVLKQFIRDSVSGSSELLVKQHMWVVCSVPPSMVGSRIHITRRSLYSRV